MTSKVSPGYPL